MASQLLARGVSVAQHSVGWRPIAEPVSPPQSGEALSTGLFVWGTWALMLAGACVYVARYGVNAPFWDEWELVPMLTGNRPITVSYLWSQQNEHRIFLPRLILLGCSKLTHGDFRAGMFLNVLILGGVAAAMIAMAGRLRGRMSYTDAFFPLALLQLGHYENWLMGFTVNLVGSTAVAGVILLVIVGCRDTLRDGSAILVGLCLLCLPLWGANGVSLVPGLALWLAVAGCSRWCSGEQSGRRDGVVLLFLSLGALSVVGMYFVGYRRPSFHPPSAGVWASVKTSLEFLSMSLGPAGRKTWPASAFALCVLCGSSGMWLLRTWRASQGERLRAAGLSLFLLAFAALGLGVGWGRSGMGPGAGFAPRYMTLAVPLLYGVFFVGVVHRRLLLGRLIQTTLLVVMSVVVVYNCREASRHGVAHRERLSRFVEDVEAGLSNEALAARYAGVIYPSERRLVDLMQMLRRARIGPFRSSSKETSRLARPPGGRLSHQMGVFRDGLWFFDTEHDGDHGEAMFHFGNADEVPVVGDWDGDGVDDFGVFHDGAWRFDVSDRGGWQQALLFGIPGDVPLVGDFNGDSWPDMVVYRRGTWFFDFDKAGQKAEKTLQFGTSSDLPLVGDFNGDGQFDMAVFRDGTWFFDLDGRGGAWEKSLKFGSPGDTPIVGDFNGDARTDIAVFRDGIWFLDLDGAGEPAEKQLVFGMKGDVPVAARLVLLHAPARGSDPLTLIYGVPALILGFFGLWNAMKGFREV